MQKPKLIINIIVRTGHKVKASVIRRLISDASNKFSHVKDYNTVLDNIIILLGLKFNLITIPAMLHKG